MKTIFYNGRVYTGDMQLASAFVVKDDMFTFAGEDAAALALACEGDERVDLGGRFVCAGFNDSHMHMLSYGNSLVTADLFAHTDSLEEMIAYFRDFARSCPDPWLVGRGWNQDYFKDHSRMPDRRDLDRVSTDRPVIAVRCCGHAMAVNTRALEILGITAETPAPEGGSIGIADGAPNGQLFDNAMELVYSVMPAPDVTQVKEMLRRACRALNTYGVTSCHSDDYAAFSNLPWQTVKQAYQELEASGELSVRVYEQCNFMDAASLAEFIRAGNVTGCGSYNFKTGPLKLLGDGALGAHTALLSRPYADAPETSGIPVIDRETIEEMVDLAHRSGMQCAVHAIGDKCLDWVLGAYEKALTKLPRADHRHGVVHCQITRPDQLEKMIKMRLHIYAQTIFLDYDSRIVRSRVGDSLAESSYNWKTLMEGGLSVSNGTDCPVERPDALRGMQCAITRSSIDGGKPYLAGQAFSVQEALDSYTIRGAEGSFEEGVKGRIRPGMLADFVVLSENPFLVSPEKISGIGVEATYMGGRKVF